MATHLCQKCKQAHPGRVCYYDEKGECAETIGVNEVAETCNEPSKDEEGGSLLRSKYAPFYDKGRAEDDSSPRLASAPKFQSSKSEQTQALAGSMPASSGIFMATTTSSNVAVLRTLPEMVMSASETRGCCSASESRRSLTL